jgi:sugar phosphate isomerase/epimerase
MVLDRMNRRELLRRLGSAATGMAAAGLTGCRDGEAPAPVTSSVPSGPLGPIGLQLYTLRSWIESDLHGTLQQVAQIGYREVEFAGYFGLDARQVGRALFDAGLYAPSAMLSVDEAIQSWEPAVDMAVELGHRWLVLAWLPEEMRSDAEALTLAAELFNRLGDESFFRGVRLGYHTRDYDFLPMADGRLPIDVLLEATDPAVVDVELDVYWTLQAGADPLAFLERWAGRVPLLHVNDRDADGRMLPVGSGLVDWRALLAERFASGIQHVFVDHELSDDPWAAAQESFGFLNSLDV